MKAQFRINDGVSEDLVRGTIDHLLEEYNSSENVLRDHIEVEDNYVHVYTMDGMAALIINQLTIRQLIDRKSMFDFYDLTSFDDVVAILNNITIHKDLKNNLLLSDSLRMVGFLVTLADAKLSQATTIKETLEEENE